jgi:two-component system response regulator QseB
MRGMEFSPKKAEGSRRGDRIVVVDDDRANLELLKRMLGHAGYDRVAGADDSASAVAAVLEEPTALLLLDLHLGNGDGGGLDVIAALRERGQTLPILVVTGDASTATADRAREAGADGLFVKPFSLEELTAAVRQQLDRGLEAG